MIVNPRIGNEVQVWYRQEWSWMPYHGKIGIVRVSSQGRPRNHGIEIDGVMVVVPCGNIRSGVQVVVMAEEYISICPTCQENGVISPLEGEEGNDFVVCKIHGEIKVTDFING